MGLQVRSADCATGNVGKRNKLVCQVMQRVPARYPSSSVNSPSIIRLIFFRVPLTAATWTQEYVVVSDNSPIFLNIC
jgi:hypothetical protein